MNITVNAQIDAPLEDVWKCWTTSEDIVKWNNAVDDWHTPRAENDLREGGRFNFRMESRSGNEGFDFSGIYTQVIPSGLIEYTIDDGRKVSVFFSTVGNKTEVIETFEAEQIYSVEVQRTGWQAILDNFKHYVEQKVRI